MSNFYATTGLLMKSSVVEKGARDLVYQYHPNLDRNTPVSLDVAQVNSANVLSLVVRSPNPEYAQDYLDQVMVAYKKYKDAGRNEVTESFKLASLQVVNDYQEKIKTAEGELQDFYKKNNVNNVQEQTTIAAKNLSEVEGKLRLLNSELDDLKPPSIIIDAYKTGKRPPADVEGKTRPLLTTDAEGRVPVTVTIAEGQPNLAEAEETGSQYVDLVDQILLQRGLLTATDDYIRAKRELVKTQAELDEFLLDLTPLHPFVIKLEAEIAERKASLAVQRAQIASQLAGRITQLEADKARTEKQLIAATADAQKYQTILGEYNKLVENLQRLNKTHDTLLATVTNIDVTKATDQSILKPLEYATPAIAVMANPVREISTGAFIGFVAGTGLIFMLGLMDGRVMSVEDITQRFDEPMLGVVPMQKRVGGQVELLKNNDQRLMFAESCRNIRSGLLYMDRQGQRPRTIVLTSSIPSEGKSTLSANLSITLGFAASRTLLVDADLRRGQLHKRFGLANERGLAEHIQDRVPLEQVIQPTGFENLDFISCGQYPAQPGELLMSARFNESIQELKKRYDFVIFDSPPVLATDDAASFATRVDATIFVVRAGYTRLRQVRASLENLYRRGVQVYGVVVNFTDHREPGYYSYKYYDYYSYRTPARPAKSKPLE
jgi:capsular exopolysaccharide synthesis family protein